MKLILALALLLCGSVASAGSAPTAPDGYYFAGQDFVRTKIRVEVVLYPDLEALRATRPGSPNLMAYTLWRKDGSCTIHMVDSRASYGPQWVGHELNHCIYGDFHKGQPK